MEITDDGVLEGTSEVVGGVLIGVEASLDEGWEGEGVDTGVLTGVVWGAEVGCAEDSGLG